jgi:hypothetical protein
VFDPKPSYTLSEAGAKDLGLLRAGRHLVFLQGAIEPPDHPLGDLNGIALLVVGRNELVDQAFGMNPTQRMDADAELAGVIGNNDGVAAPDGGSRPRARLRWRSGPDRGSRSVR